MCDYLCTDSCVQRQTPTEEVVFQVRHVLGGMLCMGGSLVWMDACSLDILACATVTVEVVFSVYVHIRIITIVKASTNLLVYLA